MEERKQMTEINDKGITLIALVVTIIVLIILATVSINMVVGENGLIKKAEQARDAYEESSKKEVEGINTMLEEMMKETGVGPHGLPLVDTLGGGSSNVVLESTVDAEDVNGNKIVVPRGFFVRTDLGTKVDNGIVIEDADGNQFVWVPCTEGQYKKHKYNDDTQGKDDRNENWGTFYYTDWSDWKEEGGNAESVKNNGGFYVGRYEAGVPDNASFSINNESNKNTMPYYIDTNSNGNKSKNVTEENGIKLKPVSKQGMQAWNYISQENAVTLSSNMYNGIEGSYDVTSSLIDGIAWDRIVDWLGESYTNIASESSDYGNYGNNTIELEENVLYAQHIAATLKPGQTGGASGWVLANRYKIGQPKLGAEELKEDGEGSTKYNSADYTNGTSYSITTHTLEKRIELATGVVEQFKLKNIYDMAGNIHEWTTETGHHSTTETSTATSTKYVVLRGGCFDNKGFNGPVSYRNGFNKTTSVGISVGFRVVLYVD